MSALNTLRPNPQTLEELAAHLETVIKRRNSLRDQVRTAEAFNQQRCFLLRARLAAATAERNSIQTTLDTFGA